MSKPVLVSALGVAALLAYAAALAAFGPEGWRGLALSLGGGFAIGRAWYWLAKSAR